MGVIQTPTNQQATGNWWNNHPFVPYALIVLLALIALLPGNATLPLIDRDEPRFTQATREMIQRGEWVVPYFNDQHRFDKPVLTYWLMRASFAVFGQNEFAARLHSVLFALLTALVLFEMGRRWFSFQTGFFAAIGWLTCLQVWIHGRLAVADMPMVFAVTLAYWAIYELLFPPNEKAADKKRAWQWFGILYFSIALGFLAKGPVALFCPLLSLIVFRWIFWKKSVAWSRLKLYLGLPLALLIIALWGVPALMKTGGEFWRVGIHEHIIKRGAGTFDGRCFFPFYYLFSALFSLFPWIAFGGMAWSAMRRNWNQQHAFLASWFVAPFLLFSFYATQLPHYVMPAFPAFFLLVARGLEDKAPRKRWHTIFFWSVNGLALLAIVCLMVMANWVTLPKEMLSLRVVFACAGTILFCFFLAAWTLWTECNLRGDLFGGIILVTAVLCFTTMANALRNISLAPRMTVLFEAMPNQAEFFFQGFEEPSLVFYSNRRWQNLPAQQPLSALIKPGARMAVRLKKERRWPQCFCGCSTKPSAQLENWQVLENVGYRCETFVGLNLARSSWAEVEVWFRPFNNYTPLVNAEPLQTLPAPPVQPTPSAPEKTSEPVTPKPSAPSHKKAKNNAQRAADQNVRRVMPVKPHPRPADNSSRSKRG